MEEEKAIATLKMLRETLLGFSKLIETLTEATARHGIQLQNIKADADLFKTLANTLEPEKLGLLVKAMMDASKLQMGTTNFMASDQYQLDDLNQGLKSTIKNFDEVLQGLT